MKKFALVLSGCGVYDGAEIHESVFCLLAMSKHSVSCDIFAPDINQYHVINHLTKEAMDDKRNVLIESARIARGDIRDISLLDMNNYDALILPGGMGAAKNLSSYAYEFVNMKVIPELSKIIIDCNKQAKAIGAVCISPVIIAKVLGKSSLTLGLDSESAKHIEEMGAVHCALNSTEVCVDQENKIYSVPAYMNKASMFEIYEGIEKMILAIKDL